ncbi:hypothetical protein RSAG8_05671, partial [Rhizoctonia solani AG-8 WAC10335]
MSLLFESVLEESQRAAMEQHPVPAFGRTRCYWNLLDSELRYLYLDPTCFVHMGEQAKKVIGTCLLDYVHPDEQKSARADLRGVMDSRTLHGSVTRVRYARLSRIREILGCNTPDTFPDAELVTVDDHYIACDVVINWVSDNVVLCFLHAIVDKGKADNDELNKTQWTNWCGTSAMTTDHAAALYDRLHKLVPSSHTHPDRIFQILINQPARPILFSWPPEGYTAGEFGKLMQRMQIGGPGASNHSKSDGGAKTSCTRRYMANQQIVDGGVLKEVESIFIPHGAVIFACHKVVSLRSPYPSVQQGRVGAPDMYHSYQPPQPHQHTLVQGHYTSDARRSANAGDYSAPGVPDSPEYVHSRTTTSGYQRGPAAQPFGPSSIPGQPQQPLSPPPPYAPNTPISQPPPPLDTPASVKREPSPQDEDATIPRVHAAPKRKRDSVPKREMNDTPDLTQGDGGRSQLSPPTKDVNSRERGGKSATAPRAGGAPPSGILRCSSCKSETSPEWRKGPSGKKDLCNACGLRYARSKQKKDGNAQPKRRREKEVALTPAPVPIPSGMPSSLPQSSHGPLSTSASTSSSSAPPSWPNAPRDHREQKRVLNEGFTAVSHSPSPPRSEARSQPEPYSEAYGARYGQNMYPQGYTNGYPMDYTRMPGSVPAYVTPELNDRPFAGH